MRVYCKFAIQFSRKESVNNILTDAFQNTKSRRGVTKFYVQFYNKKITKKNI